MSPEEELEQARVHVLIHGHVQRVFFRAATEAKAQSLGLSGWVLNRPDGAVELVAEGSRRTLNEFLAWCGHGPPRAEVQNVEVSWHDYQDEFTDFIVKS